jgi:hypothetical protein
VGSARSDDHILLVHDGVEQGEDVVVESEALRRLTTTRDATSTVGHQFQLPPSEWVEPDPDYHDPLAPGPWLAGVAAVGRTELSVIVQTRLEDATALDVPPVHFVAAGSAGFAAVLFAGLFAALRTRRRRRLTRPPPLG